MCSDSVVVMAPSESSTSEPRGCDGKGTLVLAAAKYTETLSNLWYVLTFSETAACETITCIGYLKAVNLLKEKI